jgi:predicted DNA-binding transcriptional regulator YafY
VVLLGVPAETARRYVARTVGTVEPVDETRSRLEIGADELEWLARFLLNLPFDFEVVEPGELRSELAEIGRELTATYG